jgi:hypothetical protein
MKAEAPKTRRGRTAGTDEDRGAQDYGAARTAAHRGADESRAAKTATPARRRR